MAENENLITVDRKIRIFEDGRFFDEGIVRNAKVLNCTESKVEIEMVLLDPGTKIEFITFGDLDITRNQNWFALFKDPLSGGTNINYKTFYNLAFCRPVI